MRKQIALSLPLEKNVIEMASKCFVLVSISVCLSVRPSVCLSIYLSIYLPTYLSMHLCIFSTSNRLSLDMASLLLISDYW